MGLFSGTQPRGLGVHSGKFKPCSWKPNCVNSTADPAGDAVHFVKPLSFDGDATAVWAAAVTIVKAVPRVNIVTENAGYLHAEYRSKSMGYVDDVELFLDAAAKLIQVRSASRLGIRDFGVNRARVESLRAALGAALRH